MEVYYRGERIAFTELKEPLRTVVEPVRPCQNEQNRAQLVHGIELFTDGVVVQSNTITESGSGIVFSCFTGTVRR